MNSVAYKIEEYIEPETSWLEVDDSTKPKVAEFFAGSGLVAEAMKTSFETVWANDICSKKRDVFVANHSPELFRLDSIENVLGKELPNHELSWASFPCQDLSLAGNMGGVDSARSGMVWHWLRVLDEMASKPSVVVAENVVGLISSKAGDNYLALHEALRKRGYKVGAVMLDAIHWVPQSRPRVFVIGIREDVDVSKFTSEHPNWAHSKAIRNVAEKAEGWIWWNLPEPSVRTLGLEDLIDFELPFDEEKVVNHHLNLIPENHKKKLEVSIKEGRRVFPGYKRTRNGKQVLEIRFDDVAGCLRTPSGGSSRQQLVIYKDGKLGTRLLSIRETARLMGADENFQIPGTYNQGYKAMGDAVAVPAVNYLSEHLLANLVHQAR